MPCPAGFLAKRVDKRDLALSARQSAHYQSRHSGIRMSKTPPSLFEDHANRPFTSFGEALPETCVSVPIKKRKNGSGVPWQQASCGISQRHRCQRGSHFQPQLDPRSSLTDTRVTTDEGANGLRPSVTCSRPAGPVQHMSVTPARFPLVFFFVKQKRYF